jgi:hypothetical protein
MHMPTLFHSRPAARRALKPLPDIIGVAGAIAGLGGGLAMLLIGALLTHALDQDLWLQLRIIAGLVLGPAVATEAGFAAQPILVGGLIHLAAAALLGALFEVALRQFARRYTNDATPEVAGLVYGLLIWLVAFFGVIPAVSPLLLQIYEPALIIQHLVYGAVTGLLFSMLRPQVYAIGSA